MKVNPLIAMAVMLIVGMSVFAGLNATAQPAREAREARQAGAYEYAVLPIQDLRRGRADQFAPVLEDEINDFARAGWELIEADPDFLVFRR